jgi:predicted nucleic acid-binding protein
VSAIVVDTSIWVDFFRGTSMPALEAALRDGGVILAPLVAAELMSAPLSIKKRGALADFLRDLPLHSTPLSHWEAVGALRASLASKAVTVSTPDAHIAQCAIEARGRLWSRDTIFTHVRAHSKLRLYSDDD